MWIGLNDGLDQLLLRVIDGQAEAISPFRFKIVGHHDSHIRGLGKLDSLVKRRIQAWRVPAQSKLAAAPILIIIHLNRHGLTRRQLDFSALDIWPLVAPVIDQELVVQIQTAAIVAGERKRVGTGRRCGECTRPAH